ncbi:MAG: hypothetical protein IPJ61_20670 [Tessaracoccus sp.]|uniref:hypothetical protein n=1 Tax=Tessaracoccus sp. TaxID=1971211 RepID=UPI001EC2CAB7|nr:hypothetical protein [Tessaracoccus sp.]MBK7823403.1 hypothetical protein [Tessaracoccus sp.]
MITNDELDLIELTLEQGVDDVDQLVNRAISLHGHCSALLAEVKRQRALLGMGVRVVGPVQVTATSTGTNSDAPRIAAAGSDASVDRHTTVPTVDEILQAMVGTIGYHGRLCRYKFGTLDCTCSITPSVRVRAAEAVHQLLERGRS